MAKFRCICGHVIRDQTDFLPYKAYIREDEDTQKPIELLAEALAQYFDARQQGREEEFIRTFELSRGEPEDYAESEARHLKGKPLSEVLFNLIFPFWTNYDRAILECVVCGRLWVDIEDNSLVSYLPATDVRHVLWSRHHHNPSGEHDE